MCNEETSFVRGLFIPECVGECVVTRSPQTIWQSYQVTHGMTKHWVQLVCILIKVCANLFEGG